MVALSSDEDAFGEDAMENCDGELAGSAEGHIHITTA
jgi:hypothetical protein